MTFLFLLEGIRTPFLNQLMQFITYFGQELIVIAVICTFYWCADKRFAYLLGFTYFTAGLGVQALKITFRIPRPWILDPTFQPVDSAVSGATGYSFPRSGLCASPPFCSSDFPECIWDATLRKTSWCLWACPLWFPLSSGNSSRYCLTTPGI